MDRALRRHHSNRHKVKVRHYWNCQYNGETPIKRIGIIAKTKRVCSCMMCSGHKKLYGNGKNKYSPSDQRKLIDPDY